MDRKDVQVRLLVVDDKASIRQLLRAAFEEQGCVVDTASSGEEAIKRLGESRFSIILTDLSMPGKSGMDVLRAAKSASPETEVILITAYGTIETAVEAMRLGAADFITKPFQLAEIENKVAKLVRRATDGHSGSAQTWIHPGVQHMVGASAQTKELVRMISKVAPSKSSVLITGPSGVGKELVARAIHEASPRRDRAYVALNCAALAPGVLESELFGHEKGAFTGATDRHVGRFEKAHQGTLFLDEITEIAPHIQTKLLRVLQEGEFERVGGQETIRVDVRIVAASNRDIQEAIAGGDFREDIYYRLNVFSLRVPALRERRDDIPALVDHFLKKFSLEIGKDVHEIHDRAMKILLDYAWPGNVRELENVIERAVVLADTSRITCDDLPPELVQYDPPPLKMLEDDPDASLPERTDRLEADLIRRALDQFRWNKTKAAEHLGLKRTTLQYKIKKYGLE